MKKPARLDALHASAREVILTARQTAYRAVNVSMVLSYWELGKLIFEEEQEGEQRAGYGKYLIVNLSERLSLEFGQGYSEQGLRNYRRFYQTYPIRSALRSELSWTHYRLLMRIIDQKKRAFYEEETIRSGWDTRALERQINVFTTNVYSEVAKKTVPDCVRKPRERPNCSRRVTSSRTHWCWIF